MIHMTRCDRLFEEHNIHYVKNLLLHQMEKSEQRLVMTFLDLKSLASKAIRTELIAVPGATAYSLP
jgi:hypothetical protein